MVICIFGESCTGKTYIADIIQDKKKVTIYTGNDYLRISRNPMASYQFFKSLLEKKVDSKDIIIYVISEKDQLSLIPKGAKRILVTADLDIIKERFKRRMNGVLPKPVEKMLENKHGSFDNFDFDVSIHNESDLDDEEIYQKIMC